MKCEQLYTVVVTTKKVLVYEVAATSREEAKLLAQAEKGKLVKVETLENRAAAQCRGFIARVKND